MPHMAGPIDNPVEKTVENVTSLVGRLRLDTLLSKNDMTSWAVLLISIFVGLTAGRITSWILGRLAQRCEARGWVGRAHAALALAGPVNLAMLTIGLTVGLTGLHMGPPTDPLPMFVWRTVLLLYTVAIFWFTYNIVDVIDVLVRRAARGADLALQRHIVLLMSRSVRVFLVVICTLFVAKSVFDQDIGAWLAGLGIVGLAVSLAAQDSLKSLFGSLSILLDHSFRLGDRIISCGCDGTIEDIGFRSTKIRTAAGHLVTIPNSSMVNSTIENVSRRPGVRRIITLQIAGRTPIEKLRQAIQALGGIFDEDGIRGPVRPMIDGAASAPQVRFEDIRGSEFKLSVTYWYAPADDPGYAAHAERVNLRIVEKLQRAGLELAQPTAK
jgi:MscS family membrane protein